MKNLAYILVVFLAFSCSEKNGGSPEPLQHYNFIYFVNEDTVSIFKTELIDTLDITFEFRSNIKNWEMQKTSNAEIRRSIESENFGFLNSSDPDFIENQKYLDFLDRNDGFMVFDFQDRPGSVKITTKDKVFDYFNFPLEKQFEINGIRLEYHTVLYTSTLPIGIFIVFVPSDLL